MGIRPRPRASERPLLKRTGIFFHPKGIIALRKTKSTEMPGQGSITRAFIFVVLSAVILAGCAWRPDDSYQSPSEEVFIFRERFRLFHSSDRVRQARNLLSSVDSGKAYAPVSITAPLDGSVFPADLAAPTFSWRDGEIRRWMLVFSSGPPEGRIIVLTDRNRWTPARKTWEAIKARWTGQRVDGEILGIGPGETVVSRGRIVFTVSIDPVGAPIIYQEMPLPFSYALENTHLFRWRMGDLSAYGVPKTVLKKPAVVHVLPCVFRQWKNLRRGPGPQRRQGGICPGRHQARGSYRPQRHDLLEQPEAGFEDSQYGAVFKNLPGRPIRRFHGQRKAVHDHHEPRGLLPALFSAHRLPGRLRQAGSAVFPPARRRPPRLRPDQSRMEPGRKIHRLRKGPRWTKG